MKLKEQIEKDFIAAFKSGQADIKSVLSMVRSEISNREIELGKREQGLDDQEVVAVLCRAIKQRKDAAGQFQEGGRAELAEKELSEAVVLEKYLPEQLDDAQIEEKVRELARRLGASGPQDMGKVMGAVVGELKGKADGSKVQAIVKNILEKMA